MSQSVPLELDGPASSTRSATIACVAILAGHIAVDGLAALLPSTLGLMEARLSLTGEQTAWLLGLGALCSGISQPLCALVSDRLETRTLGVIGVVLAAVGIGSLGLASDVVSLTVIYALGMIGVGMFHPIGAATIGHLRDERRTSAVSLFFVSGMIGGVLGAVTWPRLLSLSQGFSLLPWIALPVVFLAVLLHRSYADLAPPTHATRSSDTTPASRGAWLLVLMLYVAAVLRFCVNLSLFYLYVRWVQGQFRLAQPEWTPEQIATAAAPTVGNLNAATLAGMALGGLAAGAWVRKGHEKWPMVLIPLVFAPLIVLIPEVSFELGYLLAMLVGVGFASMIPITIALAQQLLPRHTNLASSLMMGGAWALAMLGPRCAEFGVSEFGLRTTFWLTAAGLAAAGIVCLPLRPPANR